MTDYGNSTEAKITEVVEACRRHGDRSIIALSGVPGVGKSYIASIAAQRFCNEPLCVREIQFHQSFSYEEFVEGMRIDSTGGVMVVPGVFLEWNERAHDDPEHAYVLLIEEFTRANLSAVLGELMTFIEHRDRQFLAVYSRRPVRIAKNLTILTTFNPTDRSAIDLDNALIRRLRIISFPPSLEQLSEMLGRQGMNEGVTNRLRQIFEQCKAEFPLQYEHLMPFGHGIFADIRDELPDLNKLWIERIVHLLRRPLVEPHPFTDVIEANYPWRNPEYSVAQESTT